MRMKIQTKMYRKKERASKVRVRTKIRTSGGAIMEGGLRGAPILLKILQKFSRISKNITDDRFVILRILYEELSCEGWFGRKQKHTDRNNNRPSSMTVHVLEYMVIHDDIWQYITLQANTVQYMPIHVFMNSMFFRGIYVVVPVHVVWYMAMHDST